MLNKYARKSHQSSAQVIAGALLLLSVFQPGTTQASESAKRDTVFFNTVPTVEQLEQQLFPRKTRSLVFNNKSTDAPAAADSSVALRPVENAVGLPVLFHFGKTTLVESTKPFLDQIGEVMQRSAAQKEILIIEGHTDAVGGIKHNHKLSELRALAVKDYLVTKYDIDPMRLFPEGKGESRLFDTENPRAAENRRVEFLRFQR